MNEKTKKVLFLTGTRADFGKIKPLIDTVNSLNGFEYDIFVTGMHLLSRYGSTYLEVQKSGYKNIHKYMNQHIDEPMEMILANTIQGLSRYIHERRPDLIVVHGDRVEALAGAIAGSLNNILVAHVEGGERSGTIDELIRHSVTKLSHIHLVANQEARNRVIQLGELSEAVFAIGSPDIDVMKSKTLPSIEASKLKYKIDFDDYHIVMFHPVTTEFESMEKYSKNLVDALLKSKENFVVIYPNNDHGTNEILETYEFIKNKPNFKIFPSIAFEHFLTLIENSKSIIGNSSAGIREAPVYGVPTINIGTRQNARHMAESIFNVDYESVNILNAIKKIGLLREEIKPTESFGAGNSAKEFALLLNTKEFWKISAQKTFVDLS